MKIIGLTDIHGETGYLDKIAGNIENADIILISGDITHFGDAEMAKDIIDRISVFNKNIFAVPGNCDLPEVGDFLISSGLMPDNSVFEKDDFSVSITGIGGSLTTPVKTPNTYTEEQYSEHFAKRIIESDILVTHQPPYKTFADRVMGGLHAGSKTIKRYIDEKQPLLCLCGHIHESSGMEFYGRTLVINPGPFREGRYASVEVGKSGIIKSEILRG